MNPNDPPLQQLPQPPQPGMPIVTVPGAIGVPPTVQGVQMGKGSGDNWLDAHKLLVIIILGVVVVVLLVALVVVSLSKTSKNPARTSGNTSQSSGPTPATYLSQQQAIDSVNQNLSSLNDSNDFPANALSDNSLVHN